MRFRSTVLIASLAINATLAVLIARRQPESSTESRVEKQSVAPVSGNPVQQTEGKTAVGAAAASTDADSSETGFRWSDLESPDYKEYIARLRAFGVPEKVVRDIIVADVAKLYRPRLAALRGPKTTNPNFWEIRNRFNPWSNMTREQREQMAALQKEQRNLVKTLLGSDVYDQMMADSEQIDWNERRFGSIPKAQRDAVSEISERFEFARSELYAAAEGYIDDDVRKDVKALRRKFLEELGSVLTPEQIHELELRNSDVAQQMRWQLSGFEPNEEEFRAIFDFKQALEDAEIGPRSSRGSRSSEEIRAAQTKEAELKEALAQALGPERLKEYNLMDQWEYRSLFESGAPKETILKIVDIKQQVEDSARQIRRDSALTPEQREEKLRTIRTETETELTNMLGARRAKAYINQGGSWLRNIQSSR